MKRQIYFGGKIIINNRELQEKAILLENNELKDINNLRAFIKTEPILTITDLINLEGKTMYL